MAIFSTTADLIGFAEKFLDERLNSLKSDVSLCIQNKRPFPGLLYCFSTIDLLGAIYEGDATGNMGKYGPSVGTTSKSKKYMIDMMGYCPYEAKLLQDVFRHKLVHLAQPNASPKFDKINKRMIGWALESTYSGKHMFLEKLPLPLPIVTLIPIPMKCDHLFTMSLSKYLDDILSSVSKIPNGLLDKIRTDSNFQHNFESAISQIFDPNL